MYIELLAPAGNLEKLKIAIDYGADAVYIAGQQFGLRSAADNFSTAEIGQAVNYAHDRRRKVYITVNAFLHDHELEQLPDFLTVLEALQPDGVICSDMGVVACVRKHTSIPIHISTQASVLNSGHAEMWKNAGAKRIVTGRELSILEAAAIKQKTGLEVEMFVQGAMCMAYSGHCTLSTYIAGRDSNRGGCIQNCRFQYQLYQESHPPVSTYFLSSRDLCGIGLLAEFIEAGIDSLKIEGRMKSNLYIASTVRAYANALKEIRKNGSFRKAYWQKELTHIPHRDYTEASLLSPAGADSVYNRQKASHNEFKLAGTVLEVDKDRKRFALHVKNKLFVGDTIEIMPFEGEIIQLHISTLTNIAESELEMIQPGNVCWLPLQENVAPRNVARIRRPEG
ncbi:MAG: U32 family peptidase [Deltaproteobacteria bacterium]|jgi:U32 family peptidase|nr:U32 family peptidase [Deltaproteobacteria bacterium]MBT4643773.1 U32 family peptidase [Deltaproteobacteria bacterium]MBT6611501.1 U32 family peptidase [Deltaproteobacteria bacterium]MBT7152432.1 U32 family peptidase [Deltaproteobacteria bacterium]MBT7711474.1 U32 family peptidase [Deltaproteobacteria bacterium]